MKAKLSAYERIKLLQILPAEGNFLTLRVVEDLKKKIGFDAKEQEHLEFKTEGDQMRWNAGKDVMMEREFLPAEVDIISATLRKLDKAEKLTQDVLSLYITFVKE